MLKISVDKIQNWMFVTGVPRSGTTFVGRVLSWPLEVDYIHEPFNAACGIPGMKGRYRYIRPSLDTEEMRRNHALIQRLFNYDFTLRTTHDEKDSRTRKMVKHVFGSRGPFYLRMAKLNPFHRAAVIKDPTGCLMAEYLYLTFGVKPVIVVRHPVSLAASLKRIDWWPKTFMLGQQKALVEDYFVDEVDLLTKKWPDRLQTMAAHWRSIYKVLLTQASRHPDWQIVKIEDISASPVDTFQQLYDALGLTWTSYVESRIRSHTSREGRAEAREGRVQDLQRDSAKIFELRLQSLSVEDRRAIFDVVQDVALQVYSKESFGLD